jgi:hypothetical protein
METKCSLKEYENQRDKLQKTYTDIYMQQSLDRSYHLGLSDTAKRDGDQVLSKSQTVGEDHANSVPLLMVPQLWLWQIDRRNSICVI